MVLLILLQAAATQLPDVELDLHARAKSVRIEQKGEARLEVRGEGPGNRVDVKVEPKAQGRTELRNVNVDVHAQASVQEGVEIDAQAETGTPQ
ncbi:MAG TPA: hypothetical protein VF574_16935 [Allosphingosinicella sp.]|jgi:hypothetical protein